MALFCAMSSSGGAQLCITRGGCSDQQGIYIGCLNPVYNSCYCRSMESLVAPITSLVSSCANSRCSSNQVGVTTAFAVCDGYCSQAGYPHLTQNNAATTTLLGLPVNPASISEKFPERISEHLATSYTNFRAEEREQRRNERGTKTVYEINFIEIR
jgi:hypothetical protein